MLDQFEMTRLLNLTTEYLRDGNQRFNVTTFGAYQPGPKFWVPVVARKLKGTNMNAK